MQTAVMIMRSISHAVIVRRASTGICTAMIGVLERAPDVRGLRMR